MYGKRIYLIDRSGISMFFNGLLVAKYGVLSKYRPRACACVQVQILYYLLQMAKRTSNVML